MNPEIENSVKSLLDKYPELIKSIFQESLFKQLIRKYLNKIPDWYTDIFKRYPIQEIEISIPFDYGWDSLKSKSRTDLPPLNTYLNSIDEIINISKNEYPAIEMKKLGFLCIAHDDNASGDGFYINTDKINSEVIYIYHDSGNTADQLIKNGLVISNSLSDFIKLLKPHQNINVWLSQNEM